MTSQPADDILRHWKDKGIYLLIPGGWRLELPEVTMDEEYRQRCIRHFIKKGALRAEAQADALIQATGVVGPKASLLSSIFYFGKMYCKMYPERMTLAPRQKKTFIPLGFRPEDIQKLHVPVRYPGQYGVQQIQKTLMEMKI
jgi:hypothetical protein